MSSRALLLVVLCLGFASIGRAASAAAADSPPTADEVEKIIATDLPGYWKVDQLSLSDPVDYGNPIEPEWRWRYEALIAPKEPLYLDSGRHEGVGLLELSLSPESAQTLYGVVIATFHAGSWSGEARHENRPFDHGGEPASFFPGRTVVVGSPEERELREATRQRELEELEARHKAKVAASKIEHQGELAAAKEAHRAALERLKDDLEEERERRQAEHQNELAVQLASLEAGLKAEAEQRRVEITESEKLTELAAEARDRFAALQAAEAERFAAASDRLTALQAEEAEMLAASERFHEARRVALKKLFDRLGVVTGPDDYLALLDTASESELDWMRVAVLRHGLESHDLALNKAAWRHLLRADISSNPDLRGLLDDHIQAFSRRPETRPIVKKLLASLSGNPETLLIVKELLAFLSGDPETLPIVKELLAFLGGQPETQWVTEVVSFSSKNREGDDYSPQQVVGEPNDPGCGHNIRSWLPKEKDKGDEFLRVRFAKPVYFPEIAVFETENKRGAVRQIILRDNQGRETEYNVKDPVTTCPGSAHFEFNEYTGPVNDVTVVLDTAAVRGWNGVDAISLRGWALPPAIARN